MNLEDKYVVYAILAILIWSTLGTLGLYTKNVPSLQLLSISLLTSGLISLIKINEWGIPRRTFIIGVGGIFGYHYLIFSAYKNAPIIEANLINYLWPLLIVFLSPIILSQYKLKTHHVIGTLLGFLGSYLIITNGKFTFDYQNLPGYLMAASAALIWAMYSLMMKRVKPFHTAAIGLFTLVSGALSVLILVLTTKVIYYPTPSEWFSLILLGLGPMGSAFFLWDKALKEGDPRVVGSISYLTPLFSTLLLVIVGGQRINLVSALSMVCLIMGALIGSKDVFMRKSSN